MAHKPINIFLISVSFFCAAVWFLNYTVDPFMRKRWSPLLSVPFYTTLYGNSTQHVLPGLVRHLDFQLAVMGTSTTAMFDHEVLQELFQLQPMKLSLPGSTPFEQSQLMKLMSGKEVKHIIWGIDCFYYYSDINHGQVGFPNYLYEEGIGSLVPYLLNMSTLRISVQRVPEGFANFKELLRHRTTGSEHSFIQARRTQQYHAISKANYNSVVDVQAKAKYYDQYKVYEMVRSDGVTFLNSRIDLLDGPISPKLSKMIENFEINILPHWRENPQITFDVLLPPYSVMFWVRALRNREFRDYLELRERIASQASLLKNVRLHDMQADWTITSEQLNYYDYEHFDERVSRAAIEGISKSRYIVAGLSEIQENNRTLRRQMRELTAEDIEKRIIYIKNTINSNSVRSQ